MLYSYKTVIKQTFAAVNNVLLFEVLSKRTHSSVHQNCKPNSYKKYRATISKNDSRLRKAAKLNDISSDSNEAWLSNAYDDERTMEKYASAMHTLALTYWKKEIVGKDWIYNRIIEYYNGGMTNKYNLEKERVSSDMQHLKEFETNRHKCDLNDKNLPKSIKVLDVGSCYNPFSKYPELDITAIDLCPAVPEVKRCDFLKLEVTANSKETLNFSYRYLSKWRQVFTRLKNEWMHNSISQLEEESFDVVIFSSFIQCIPGPHRRFDCFLKACKLLKPNGILVVGMYDNLNVGRAGHIFKLIRTSVGFAGLHRIKLEKYLDNRFYGMVFRKGLSPSYQKELSTLALEIMKSNPKTVRGHSINYEVVPSCVFLKYDFPILANPPKKLKKKELEVTTEAKI